MDNIFLYSLLIKYIKLIKDAFPDVNPKVWTEKKNLWGAFQNYLTKEEICNFIPNAIKKNPESMIRILIKQVVVYDDKIEIFYNFTSKNPDDSGRDFTLIKGSDNYPMVEVGRIYILLNIVVLCLQI